MALKVSQVLFFIFLLFLVFFSIGHAKSDMPREIKKLQSPFEFFKVLEGCNKGIKTEGIHHLKNYLRKFGYLESQNEGQDIDEQLFDDALESAIKIYQRNYHINPTGTLDATTVSKMIAPRCGMPDIINGTNTMLPKNWGSSSETIHIVSHYTFFNGNPRWPSSKTHLTYLFLPNTPGDIILPTVRAFQKWASVTQFTFSQVSNDSDLVIGFFVGQHGDGSPFDGPGGVLAHSFPPTDGRLHFDAEEAWSTGPIKNAFDLESTALHEIGHLLGLGHSSVEAAVMYPGVGAGVVKNILQPDDIEGIKALYGL